MNDTPLTDGAQFLAQFYEDHELVEGFVVTAETAQRMERGRAELLNLLTAIADGSPHTPAQYWSERARAAIAKATGASHE